MKSVAQAISNATEQLEDLFADIGGTPLTDAQADAVEGEGLIMQIVAILVVAWATIRNIY